MRPLERADEEEEMEEDEEEDEEVQPSLAYMLSTLSVRLLPKKFDWLLPITGRKEVKRR